MFQSMFGRLQPQPPIAKPDNALKDATEEDEDGFLLIGQTNTEKTTLTNQQFTANQSSPYDCTQVNSQCQPDYQNSLASGMTAMNMSGLPPFNTDASNNNHMLPISDIPFQLAPQLTVLQRLNLRTDDLSNQTAFDWSKYNYDFTCELSYLKEHGIQGLGGQRVNLTTEERSLIQF